MKCDICFGNLIPQTEQIHPKNDCVCPRGPVWNYLKFLDVKNILKLEESLQKQHSMNIERDKIIYWDGTLKQFRLASISTWKESLIEFWDSLCADLQKRD